MIRLSSSTVLGLRFAEPVPPPPGSAEADVQKPAPVPRKSYHPKARVSDLKEAEWGKISRFFPQPEVGPKNRRTPIRVLLNAIFFRLENQLPLREVQRAAPDYPPWGSLHSLESRISDAGLWHTIIDLTGRSHLHAVVDKLVRTARGEQSAKPGARVNIEGLAMSLRMSGEPQPLVSVLHHGRHANGSHESEVGDEDQNWNMQQYNREAAHKAFSKALASGKIESHRARPHPMSPQVGRHERLFTADPEGNVAAHYYRDPLSEEESHSRSHRDDSNVLFDGAYHYLHGDSGLGSIDPWKGAHRHDMEKAHKDAVAAGHIHSKYTIHGNDFDRAMLRGAADADNRGDESGRLILSDYLSENGLPGAEELRDPQRSQHEGAVARLAGIDPVHQVHEFSVLGRKVKLSVGIPQ